MSIKILPQILSSVSCSKKSFIIFGPQEILLAATYFRVDDLQNVCVRYLKDKIDKR